MGVRDRKRREAETLRQQILDAAEAIIVREGIRHVTMRRIAAEVEYAPTVLYRLFANKRDLMGHLVARGYAGVRRGYEDVLKRTHQDPLQTLADLLKAYAAYAESHPNHYRMWFSTGELRLDEGRLVMRHGDQEFVVFEAWFECIETCRGAGLFPGRDRMDVFQALWSWMHGAISLRLEHPALTWPPIADQIDMVLEPMARPACLTTSRREGREAW